MKVSHQLMGGGSHTQKLPPTEVATISYINSVNVDGHIWRIDKLGYTAELSYYSLAGILVYPQFHIMVPTELCSEYCCNKKVLYRYLNTHTFVHRQG